VNFSIVVVARAQARRRESKMNEKLDEFGHIRLGGIGSRSPS